MQVGVLGLYTIREHTLKKEAAVQQVGPADRSRNSFIFVLSLLTIATLLVSHPMNLLNARRFEV